MKAEWQDFWRDILKNIIDKLLVGGIVGVAIFLSTQWLESYKQLNSTNIEINQKKIEKLAEVWEQAYLLDKHFQKYESIYVEIDKTFKGALNSMKNNLKHGAHVKDEERKIYDLEAKTKDKYSKKLAEANKEHLRLFQKTLDKNRFWIEDKYLIPLEEYSHAVGELARLLPLKNADSIAKARVLEKRISRLSITINDVRNEILHDGI
ncbi:hypothetical protein M9194_11760 [Vibrio sp. S4M6]|uniref:hypothetical protein n=1 Tax=Vibrio sinus TaxID=2946865 RepID=UPI00202AB941|nr:hypothetical protein [Vibrio sinus]MCL9782103.1 hypothetical protein [Vibrio sinus]